MKNILTSFTLFLLSLVVGFSQSTIDLCVNIDGINPEGYDIFSEYGFEPGTLQFENTECYQVINDILFISDDEMCCGSYTIPFSFLDTEDTLTLFLEIKCSTPKPDCTIINLSESASDPSGLKPIFYACDMSPITYLVDEAPGQPITWDAGVVPVDQGPDHQAEIIWPGPGDYSLTVTTGASSITYCIEVLDSPNADFTISGGCGCLNTSVDFMSTGIGGNEFFWDFGDGAFGTGENASHTYTSPGIYDVILVVVQDNFDQQGRPLCCCSDTITYPITIEPLEGPDIYWISTLCEGDTTKYWTDAMDCSYLWAAEDSDGVSVLPFGTDITNDTLCVVWGDGPFGTVSLQVTGCSDGPYCAKPSSVIVPIIESVTTIMGRDTVCSQSSEFYDVPKWPTVTYNWSIDPPTAGFISSGQGTNAITISWGIGPATATVNVEYSSEFLGGIAGHTPEDCAGSASYVVDILPEFEIKQPLDSKFCIDEIFTIEAGDVGPTTISPVNGWTYELRPDVGSPIIATGVFGPYSTSLPTPGVFIIAAYPDYPNPYCNDTAFARVEIIEVPLPDSITGEKIICPNSTETYFGFTSTPGTQLEWDVAGGAFDGPSTGNPVTIDWGASGPYEIKVRQVQTAAPQCASDYITCPITPKAITPPTDILGFDGCVNIIQSYTVDPLPIDPEATYSWEISPVGSGSIIAGETSTTCDIQWNDTPGSVDITVHKTLCGITVSYTKTFNLNAAAPVTISQNMAYCVGSSSVTLTASTPSATYLWDAPTGGPMPGGQTISISEGGNYVVTVTETTGCTAVANHFVNEIEGPNTNLTSPDVLNLCTSGIGETVSLHALDGPWIITEWWKKTNAGIFMLQPLPVDPLVFTHINSGVVGTCTYYYVAMNTLSCESESNTIIVNQSLCPGGGTGSGCIPESHTAGFTYTPSTNCNEVTFMPSNSANVTITGWDFNDPINITPSGPGPVFEYTTAGYYVAYMYYSVPEDGGGGTCNLNSTTSVCIPMVANFSITNNNCGNYTFTNTSSYISGMQPTTFDWNFGDGNTDSGMSTSHTYTTYGMQDVTLSITNPDGCESEITITIDVQPPPSPTIIAMPSDTCVDKPFMFSNMDDTGIVGWDWQFGDGSSNGDDAPSHAYTTAGTYMVTLTVTDENGCTGSDITTVEVHPAPVEGPITYADDLFLCPGETIILNAPAGDTYEWSDGSSLATLAVTDGGVYGVTVTDAMGCSFVPDSVEVILMPEIDATITGSNVICDDGCTTLFAVSAAGYSYEWRDQSGTILPPNSPSNSVDICHGLGITDVILVITDDNSCMATNSVSIEYFTSPVVNIIPSDPSLCAGTPNTLTASTTYPDPVNYSWSTGDNTPSITVGLEGSYYVTITDPVTGCSGSDVIVINPLPDLCIVPAGCYEACDPDTLCATPGLTEYEWYFNGAIEPAYSGMECIIVTESGTYNFEGTNEFGCSDISEPLILELIPCCRPGDTEISAIEVPALGSCCYVFSYELQQDIFYSLDLHSDDAGLGIDVGSVDPSLSVTSSIPALNSFESSTSGNPLPMGPVTGFITICLEDNTTDPVEILADWRGEDGSILCTDTLSLECEVEVDCIYILEDSLYCGPNENLLYTFTVCNPADAEYAIGFIDLIELSPLSAMFVPSEIDLTAMPLLPGECREFTLDLIGTDIANDTLKFKLVGHQDNPYENPGTLCCSADSTYCVFIPGCTICDMMYVSDIDTSDLGDCCYDVTVFNYYSDMAMDGIDLCVLTPGATFDIVNPMSSTWDVSALTDTNASLGYSDGPVSFIPLGSTSLPTICIAESDTPIIDIEIKWMKGNEITCIDTISLLCEGDCGYMSDASIICGPDGSWIFSGYITNTSEDVMSSASIDLGNEILDGYNTSIDLGDLAPGDTWGPFSIVIDIPSVALEELCIITTLHSVGHTDAHEDCCQFKTILELPQDCPQEPDCKCGPEFEAQVEMGMSCTATGGAYTFEFFPLGNFSECDRVIWDWREEQIANTTLGNESIIHTFPSPGEYTVCMTVVRTEPSGLQCKERICKDINVFDIAQLNSYPNPATDKLYIVMEESQYSGQAQFQMIDANNRVVKVENTTINPESVTSIDVLDLNAGVYILRAVIDNNVITKRVLVIH